MDRSVVGTRRGPTLTLLAAGPAGTSGARLPGSPEGFGAAAKGGVGGAEIVVDSLADDGPGSLRAALTTSGPRQVRFAVAGMITLQSPIIVTEGRLTVDGSTAPGLGVMIRTAPDVDGPTVSIRTEDVILRYLRFRAGSSNVVGGTITRDSLNIFNSQRVLVDHCSLSWSVDEVIGMTNNTDVTLQWCVIAQPLYKNNHKKGWHGMAILFGGPTGGRISFHHNLIAHADQRTPRVQVPETVEIVNNVIYNWGAFGMGLTPNGSGLKINIIGNRFQSGNDTKTNRFPILIDDTLTEAFYVSENYDDIRRTLGSGGDAWDLVGNSEAITTAAAATAQRAVPWPGPVHPIGVHLADDVLPLVLANAGARLPALDRVDNRILSEVARGFAGTPAGQIINAVSADDITVPPPNPDRPPDTSLNAGGWPSYG